MAFENVLDDGFAALGIEDPGDPEPGFLGSAVRLDVGVGRGRHLGHADAEPVAGVGGGLDQGDDPRGEGVVHRHLGGCFVGRLDTHPPEFLGDLRGLLVLRDQDGAGQAGLQQALVIQHARGADMGTDPLGLETGPGAGSSLLAAVACLAFVLFLLGGLWLAFLGLGQGQPNPEGLADFRAIFVLGGVIRPDLSPLCGGVRREINPIRR